MNSDYLNKRKRFVRPVLLGVSAVLAALALAKLRDFYTTAAEAQSIVGKAVDQDNAGPNQVDQNLAEFRKTADALKKKNLFAPPPPKRHPVSSVVGIMGNEALIDGKWYKAGDRISDAEIVAVEATLVKIKWDGQEKTFAPISALVADASGSHGEAEKAANSEKEKPEKAAAKAERVVKKVVVSSDADDPLAWMGVKLSPEQRRKIMMIWKNASEEDRQRGVAEWNDASEEKRREMLSQLEAMPDMEMGG